MPSFLFISKDFRDAWKLFMQLLLMKKSIWIGTKNNCENKIFYLERNSRVELL